MYEPTAANGKNDARDNIAVKITDLAVRYRVPREKYSGIKEYAIRWLQRRVEYIDLWALSDVSLKVEQGEIFGVIGPNGAGKSTLLKVIAGILFPQRGRVRVQGTIAPLLGLGAGFHPELTGRENVYLYGSLLGYTRSELDELYDEIVEFADLAQFIDSPLRTYSGGMSLRLGFSVATAKPADILLVDEVLAVGDAEFQKKCIMRMQTFREAGTSIVYVSHDLGVVENICDRVVLLDRGRIKDEGEPGAVIMEYLGKVTGQAY